MIRGDKERLYLCTKLPYFSIKSKDISLINCLVFSIIELF